MWDQQGGVPGRGDYPLLPNTAYSIELIRIMLEEDAFFDGTKVWFIDGRQEELILIPRMN